MTNCAWEMRIRAAEGVADANFDAVRRTWYSIKQPVRHWGGCLGFRAVVAMPVGSGGGVRDRHHYRSSLSLNVLLTFRYFRFRITMRLSDFFQLSETKTATYTWVLVSRDPAVSPEDALARALAERIVMHQCRGSLHHYEAWKQRAENGVHLPESSRKALREAFIGPVLGIPEEPNAIPLDHLEGYVSQMLWYFLYLESPPEEIVRVEPPGFKSTDPGGDALAIHRVQREYLMFRLWEIKKFTRAPQSSTSVNSTVNRAYKQLNAKALEYLARYTAIGQEISDPELADFYGQLVDLWLEARKEAAAGVSIVTSLRHVPQRCFTTFSQHFPKFVNPVRLRGMLTAVEDFSSLTLKVREFIWRGLL